MNYYKKFLIIISILQASLVCVFASTLTIRAPEKALSNRQPFVVEFFLDTEGETVSGLSGNFSFPTDLFTIDSISTEDSVISVWMNQPAVSSDKYLDTRTHITFEGIFPGGYNGVRSPYYSGTKPGVLFSVKLVPKNEGNGIFLMDDLELHAYNENATRIPLDSAFKMISVPSLLPLASKEQDVSYIEVKSPSLSTFITQDILVNRNAWYLVVNEREPKSSIQKILVAETDDYAPSLVKESSWKEVTSPYVLFYQDRSKYVHVKIMYSNHTFTFSTLPPVENFLSNRFDSRILVAVVFVLSLLYIYGKYLFIVFKKQS